MNRKKALLDLFNIGKMTERVSMVLLITKHKNYPEPELIGVPKENFELKAQYIESAYNDDLVLNSCEDIEIVGVKVLNKTGGVIGG